MALVTGVSRLVNSAPFHRAVIFLIVVNGLYLGAEATPGLYELHGQFIDLVLDLCLGLFLLEIGLRLLACWPQPGRFFRSPRNVFDFAVVALSLLPGFFGYLLAARLLRLLRLFRLFTGSTTWGGLLAGGDGESPGRILVQWVLSVAVVAYIFALAGVYLFGETAPADWGSLRTAVASLADLLLWQDVEAFVTRPGNPRYLAPAYLATFYVAMGVLLAAAFVQSRRRQGGPR